MNDQFELIDLIKNLIHSEMTYYKHYTGKVLINIDPKKKGKIQVTLEEEDRTDFLSAIWANPRQGRSFMIPNVGEYVEVYFMNADKQRPVYLYPMSEWEGKKPVESALGLPIEDVIYEPNTSASDNITYNKVLKTLTFLSGTEPMVKGATFQTLLATLATELTALTTVFNAHTHIYAPGPLIPIITAPPPVPQVPPTPITGFLSLFMRGK